MKNIYLCFRESLVSMAVTVISLFTKEWSYSPAFAAVISLSFTYNVHKTKHKLEILKNLSHNILLNLVQHLCIKILTITVGRRHLLNSLAVLGGSCTIQQRKWAFQVCCRPVQMVTTAVDRVTGGLQRGQMAAVALPSRRLQGWSQSGKYSRWSEQYGGEDDLLKTHSDPSKGSLFNKHCKTSCSIVICNNKSF